MATMIRFGTDGWRARLAGNLALPTSGPVLQALVSNQTHWRAESTSLSPSKRRFNTTRWRNGQLCFAHAVHLERCELPWLVQRARSRRRGQRCGAIGQLWPGCRDGNPPVGDRHRERPGSTLLASTGGATPGHVNAARRLPSIAPIFAQQSVRENARTGRTPQRVMDEAMWGLIQEGWRGGLLNQSPHNLDLPQWICGMPSKVWRRAVILHHSYQGCLSKSNRATSHGQADPYSTVCVALTYIKEVHKMDATDREREKDQGSILLLKCGVWEVWQRRATPWQKQRHWLGPVVVLGLAWASVATRRREPTAKNQAEFIWGDLEVWKTPSKRPSGRSWWTKRDVLLIVALILALVVLAQLVAPAALAAVLDLLTK
jgi:hypothetical protein